VDGVSTMQGMQDRKRKYIT
jgi:hypothetical protein